MGPTPGNNQEPPQGNNPPQVTGQLSLSLNDLSEGIRRGDSVTYALVVRNDRNVADENVQLTIRLSEGLRFVRLNGPGNPQVAQSQDGRMVSIQPLRFLRPGEAVNYQIEAQTTAPGKQILRIEAVSNQSQQPVVEEEDTTVY